MAGFPNWCLTPLPSVWHTQLWQVKCISLQSYSVPSYPVRAPRSTEVTPTHRHPTCLVCALSLRKRMMKAVKVGCRTLHKTTPFSFHIALIQNRTSQPTLGR